MNGTQVRERRQALGLTQKQLADMVGWSEEHVCRVERGKRPVVPILPLALEGIEAMHLRQEVVR